jgi:hypothetical protein
MRDLSQVLAHVDGAEIEIEMGQGAPKREHWRLERKALSHFGLVTTEYYVPQTANDLLGSGRTKPQGWRTIIRRV